MKQTSSITIIDDKNIRGVVAPTKQMSRRLLEDIVDLIELSSSKIASDTVARIREADRENSWIPLSKIRETAS